MHLIKKFFPYFFKTVGGEMQSNEKKIGLFQSLSNTARVRFRYCQPV